MMASASRYCVGVRWFLLCFILKGNPAVHRSKLRTEKLIGNLKLEKLIGMLHSTVKTRSIYQLYWSLITFDFF